MAVVFKENDFVLVDGKLGVVVLIRRDRAVVHFPDSQAEYSIAKLTRWTLRIGDKAKVEVPLDMLAHGYNPVPKGTIGTISDIQVSSNNLNYICVFILDVGGRSLIIYPCCLKPV